MAALPFKPSALATGLGSMFGTATAEHQAVESALARSPAPRRRSRLIDLDPTLHCSIIGTCLATGPLRRCVARQAGLDRDRASDHALHHAAVELASRPGEASKALDKLLDETHAAVLRRFAKATDAGEVQALWVEALKQGDVPGAYWAVMTHPQADDAVRGRAFGDVHMLSHLVGASNRADIRRLAELEARHAEDQARLDAQQQRWEAGCRDRDRAVAGLEAELATARARARLPAEGADDEATALRRRLRQAEDQLARRAEEAAQAKREAASAGTEIARLGEELLHAREGAAALGRELLAVEAHLRSAGQEPADEAETIALRGKAVLYVGGRPSSNAAIRAIAARWGVALAMHDGGIEDRKGLLAAALARADVVLFPVDCIDHDSMNALKRRCQRRGLPFHALRSAGVASFVALMQALDADGLRPPPALAGHAHGCLHHG